MREIKKRIEEAHAQRGREVRMVERVRWDGVVRWGARGEGEDGISCEFEDSLECCEGGREFHSVSHEVSEADECVVGTADPKFREQKEGEWGSRKSGNRRRKYRS